MATFDGDINDIANDVVAADGVKARAFLSKLDPADPQDIEDGKRFIAAVKSLLSQVKDPQDPQDAEDGKRFIAGIKKLFGFGPESNITPIDKPIVPAKEMDDAVDAMKKPVVDTAALTGPLPALKNFLIKSQRDAE